MKQAEHAQPHEVSGMNSDGWSNSPEAKDAPKDVLPDVTAPTAPAPGWSNRTADQKVVSASTTEDKRVGVKRTTAKAAAKKQ